VVGDVTPPVPFLEMGSRLSGLILDFLLDPAGFRSRALNPSPFALQTGVAVLAPE
jgi:hypothetical protein